MAYGLSSFPESYDNFRQLRDLPPNKIQDAQRYQLLKAKEVLTTAESTELNQLTVELQDYIISPVRWNHMSDALIATQKTFSTDVTTYFQGKQNEINTFVNTRSSELQSTQTSAINTINSTKDSALIVIEQKKENIIDYMDSTNTGQIRNDLGIMGDLTTTDQTSLVDAINEVNDSLSTHVSNRSNPHNVTATQVGAYTKTEVDDKIGILNDEIDALEVNLGNKTTLLTTEKTSIVNAVNELFTYANNGKSSIATAVTNKGVSASPSDTFSVLAGKIGQINTGKKWASGSFNKTSSFTSISTLAFRPSYVILAKQNNESGLRVRFFVLTDLNRSNREVDFMHFSTDSSTVVAQGVMGVNWSFGNYYPVSGTDNFIIDNGFELPDVVENGDRFEWIAYE